MGWEQGRSGFAWGEHREAEWLDRIIDGVLQGNPPDAELVPPSLEPLVEVVLTLASLKYLDADGQLGRPRAGSGRTWLPRREVPSVCWRSTKSDEIPYDL